MDMFTEKANKIMQKEVMSGIRKKMPPPEKAFKDKSKYNRKHKHKQDYDEDAEDSSVAQQTDPTGITPGQEKAINLASRLATKPGKFNLPFIGAQAKMNSAYGDLMKALATKIATIAKTINT